MRIVDDLIFSPSEIVPERDELSLSEMGLSVIGFQVSEMGTDATKIKGARGPIVVATTPKERVATITLVVREDAEASLATAAYRLQQKLGQIEEVGDWLKRVPYVGDFAGPVVCKVHREVSLGNMGQWQAGESPDVTLQLLTGGEWFDAEEEEVEVETETVGRATIITIPPSRGTTRGLERLRLKNEGEEDLRALLYAKECRDAPADLEDPTALLAYNCADLTPKGGAEVKTVSGLEVVEASLTVGWITILDSEIDGVGHMTHAGGRRPWLRVQNPEEAEAQLRLRYRLLGSTSWEENKITPILHHGGDYQYYDMGQVRTMLAKLGDQRWQFQIVARALSGSGKLRLHQVYPAPIEQYLVVKQPYEPPQADLVSTKSPGTVENNAAVGTTNWESVNNAKASDNAYAVAKLNFSESKYLLAKGFGFALPEGAMVTGILVSIERQVSVKNLAADKHVQLVKGGVVQATDKAGGPGDPWSTTDVVRTYGGSADLWDGAWTASDINSATFGVALSAYSISAAEAKVDAISVSVYYAEGEDEDRICSASRSVEFRTDGVERQHPTDDVWGTLVPDGFLPYDPPGAIEGKPSRAILIPSQGDFGDLSDAGPVDVAVESCLRRPAYHLAREAAS